MEFGALTFSWWAGTVYSWRCQINDMPQHSIPDCVLLRKTEHVWAELIHWLLFIFSRKGGANRICVDDQSRLGASDMFEGRIGLGVDESISLSIVSKTLVSLSDQYWRDEIDTAV